MVKMEALTLQSRASRPTSPQPMDRDDWDDVEGNRFRIKYAHRYADYVDGGRDFFVKDIYGKDEAEHVLAVVTHTAKSTGLTQSAALL